MAGKKDNLHISIESGLKDRLTEVAKRAGIPMSSLLRALVDKYLPLVLNEEKEIPVIIKIPAHLKDDEIGLRECLETKIEAIIKALKC